MILQPAFTPCQGLKPNGFEMGENGPLAGLGCASHTAKSGIL
jgi:hypothetical protein